MYGFNFTVYFILGVNIQSPKDIVTCRVILTRLINMKQFNGMYGWLFCENPGTTLPLKPLHRFWPQLVGLPSRSHSSVMENAKSAMTTGSPVSHTNQHTIESG